MCAHALLALLLSSSFLALVIGRFHRQSRRVSVAPARSAVRCDVVQGQGHMVTGGRSGTLYRYISTTSRDPLFPSIVIIAALATSTTIESIPVSRCERYIVNVCRLRARRLTLRRSLVDFQGHATR